MKKIFKALTVLACTAAIGAGAAAISGCSKGYDGVYEGDYHYTNEYGAKYGMKVKVTVENNIIKKVEDVTKGEYTIVSPGWVDKYIADYNAASEADKADTSKFPVVPQVSGWGVANVSEIEAIAPSYYGWSNSAAANWTTNESWLLQQYEGLAVSDVLEMSVFIKETGEPYSKDKNGDLGANNLLITGSTQGSGRLLLAVQNALGKDKEIGRIEKAD